MRESLNTLDDFVNESRRLFDPDSVDGYNVWVGNQFQKRGLMETERISIRGKDRRSYAYSLGLIDEEMVYENFASTVEGRNAFGFVLKNRVSGEKIHVSDCSRWGNIASYKRRVRKGIVRQLDGFKNPVMVSLSIQPSKVFPAVPDGSNLKPIAWFLGQVGSEVTKFLKRVRLYQERQSIKWEFVAWVLEIGQSGWPNVHIIFRSRWLGNIKEIAGYWPWSEPQGVDVSDANKLKKRHPEKNYSQVNLASYVTKYVTKVGEAVVTQEDGSVKSVHKSWAWVWFWGVRIFNLSHIARSEKEEKPGDWIVIGRVHIRSGVEYLWETILPEYDYGLSMMSEDWLVEKDLE